MVVEEAETVGDIHHDVKYAVNSDTEHKNVVKGSTETFTGGKIPQ